MAFIEPNFKNIGVPAEYAACGDPIYLQTAIINGYERIVLTTKSLPSMIWNPLNQEWEELKHET